MSTNNEDGNGRGPSVDDSHGHLHLDRASTRAHPSLISIAVHSPDDASSEDEWMSPLDRISQRSARRAVTSSLSSSNNNNNNNNDDDDDMRRPDEQGVVHLQALGERRLYRSPNTSSTRMPFHGDESFPGTPSRAGTPGLSTTADDHPASYHATGKGFDRSSQVQLLGDDGDSSKASVRVVSFAPSSSTTLSCPSPDKDASWGGGSQQTQQQQQQQQRWWWRRSRWDSSYNMYACFLAGIVCAAGHHVFYAALDGQPAQNQTGMLRYGAMLAYAAKAGFTAATVAAFRQRVWATVRTRFVAVGALDAMFAAAEDVAAMLDRAFVRDARAAYLLALFAWTTPLVVILTANTLLVEPRTVIHNTTCPAVRTLNLSMEETADWRRPTKIAGLFQTQVSLWNTTQRDGGDDVNDADWFDYYTGASRGLQQTATLGAFLEEAVPRSNAAVETCGAGWNCTFEVAFTAPGYRCSEMASGVGTTPRNLSQESGEAVPPFGTDVLLPNGNFSYYAVTDRGEYAATQLSDLQIGGVPARAPPYPAHLGALRTEPVVWIGFVVLTQPNRTQPRRNESGWADAFVPKMMACEHRETAYVANLTYTDGVQTAEVVARSYGAPVINTTYLAGVDADDGTSDNTTATPEANYVYPRDTARYRRVAAYHSLGSMLRGLVNGTVESGGSLAESRENTQAVQTKLLDRRNNYFPYPDLGHRLESLYDDIILSLLSNPQFVEVVWAARPGEQSGTLRQGGDGDGDGDGSSSEADYMYSCRRFRTDNAYAYHKRDLWLVYGVAAMVTLTCVAVGALAVRDNGGVSRNTRFSSIVAATRGAALDKVAWHGPLHDRGDVAADVKRLRLGYGKLVGDMGVPVGEMRCGFGLKGDVDQRHRQGSLFHR